MLENKGLEVMVLSLKHDFEPVTPNVTPASNSWKGVATNIC